MQPGVEIQVCADDFTDTVHGCDIHVFKRSQQLIVELLDKIEQKVLLAWIVVIKGARSDAHLGG
jgi:hypothetical protein